MNDAPIDVGVGGCGERGGRIVCDRRGGAAARGGRGGAAGQAGRGGGAAGHGGQRVRTTQAHRQRIIDAFEGEEDYVEVARVLGVKKETARSIIRVYVTEGRAQSLPTGGSTYRKVTDDMRAEIRRMVTENPFTTLKKINEQLRANEHPNVCDQTIARVLDGMLITLKSAGKEAYIPFERNRPATIVARLHYAQWYVGLGVNDHVVYVDESGYNIYTRRSRGRADRGVRVRHCVVGNRGRNIVATLAINANFGLIHHWLVAGTTTRETFQRFLNELVVACDPIFPDDERVHIVYDGARPHLRMNVPANLQHRFTLSILPPYSPFLNPTEHAHSCFKAAVKLALADPHVQLRLMDEIRARAAQGMTLEAWRLQILLEVGQTALGEITVQKCTNWCARVMGFIPACLASNHIDG